MSQKYEKLKTLLKELFQLDQPDLDFGLYRVMHAKSEHGNFKAAVLVPIDEWRRLEKRARPDLKELLLAPQARTEALTPPRPPHRRRVSPSFE